MLYGVEAETSKSQLICDPATPVLDIFNDFAMAIVEIGEHHVVCIALFVGHIICPSELVLAKYFVDTSIAGFVIVVHTRKVVETVLLLGVFAFTGRKGELGITCDIVRF